MRSIVLAAVLAVLAPRAVLACSCGDVPWSERIEHADVIAIGRVADVAPATGKDTLFAEVVAHFGPLLRFKDRSGGGPLQVWTARHSESCGVDFEPGTTYLLFAYRDDHGRLGTTWCDRTAPISAYALFAFVFALPLFAALLAARAVLRRVRLRRVQRESVTLPHGEAGTREEAARLLGQKLRGLAEWPVTEAQHLDAWHAAAKEVAEWVKREPLADPPHFFWHYLSDADVRLKDPRYRRIHEEKVWRLIAALEQGSFHVEP
jgi:hypothetical protein